jgi:hypothetical protein
MKSFTFHGNQFCVYRETGLEPSTPYLERLVTAEPLFLHLLNLKSGRGLPLSMTNQVIVFYLPLTTCLTDFTILARQATIDLARKRYTP